MKVEELKQRLAQVADLNGATSLLGWDQQTYMPAGGGPARAEQLATLGRLSHQILAADETDRLLEAAAGEVSALDPNSDAVRLVAVARRDFEKARKIPSALVAELARSSSQAMEIWLRARETSSFSLFQPALAKMFDLNRELAECLGYKESPYDALIDQYEPEMKVSELAPVFSTLKTELIALVQLISPRIRTVDDSFLRTHYAESKQWNFGLDVLRRLGFDFDCGRQDKSVHPFTTSFSIRDVRITTRVDENFLPSALFGTLHEAGHALYEQGVNPGLERTPLSGGASLGIHESQSRLWENLVGRSREFWQFFFPKLQEWFPDNLTSTSLETFYRGINRVEPSLIRVEADEVTYNLHILIRFELELDLLEKRLDVKNLPEAWNCKMKEYLGVVPSNHSEGVLQDVHWSNGLIGYFPTYSLGNLISVQLYQEAVRQNSSIVDEIAEGHFETLLHWLREHVHRSGRKFFPSELLVQATGKGLQAEPYIAYLKEKYSAIYSLESPGNP